MKELSTAERELTRAARAILKAKIRIHRDAARYVASSIMLDDLPDARLLQVGRELGIDIGGVIERAQEKPDDLGFDIEWAAQRAEGYAFSGAVEFDLKLELLGQVVYRKAKIVYEHTPEWTYLSRRTGSERLGFGSSTLGLKIRAMVEGEASLGKNGKTTKGKTRPKWVESDLLEWGVLPDSLQNKFFDMIDEDARRQDAANRARLKVTP